MNKIYKVIWSKVRNCYVAVSEIAKRNGKSCTSVNCGGKANRSRGLRMAAVTLGVTAALVGGVGFGTPAAWADGTITVSDASQPENPTTTTGGTLDYSSGFYYPSDPSINQLKITGGVNNSYGFAARYTYGSGESVTGYTVDVSGAGTSITSVTGIRITGDSSGKRAASGNRVYITNGASVNFNVYGADGIGVVSGNMVTIDKAYAYRVVGGESGVAAKGNIVNISGIKEGMAYTVSDYVRGGYSQSGTAGGTGENEGNKVNISNGAIVGIYDAVIGGSGGGGAISNEVTINKSLVENYVLGGSASIGSVSKNTVDISGKMDGKNYTVTRSVYGGFINNGIAVSGNIVKITDAVVNENSDYDYSVYGGFVYSYDGTSSAEANSNNVTVSGNSKTGTVYGGYSVAGAAKGNTVTINKNEKGETPQIEGYIYGGYSEKGTAGGATAEEGNKVTISGGTVDYYVYGGYVNSGTGAATGNKVDISQTSSEVLTRVHSVYGGYSNNGTAGGATAEEGNKVTITGGRIGNRVYGGYVSGTGAAIGNKVDISQTGTEVLTIIDDSVYGGYSNNGTAGGATAEEGNKVTINGGTVGSRVYGGYVYSGTGAAIGNKVDISQTDTEVLTTISDDVYGGYSRSGTAGGTGENEGNTVTINGGTVNGNVYGGYASSGEAHNNIVTVGANSIINNRSNRSSIDLTSGYSPYASATGNMVNVQGTVKGGNHIHIYIKGGESGGTGEASNNKVTFKTGSYVEPGWGGFVYGGYVNYDGNSNAVNNTVTFEVGSVAAAPFNFEVCGGYANGTGTANNNTVTVNGVTVTGRGYLEVIGGKSNRANSTNSNNTVNLLGTSKIETTNESTSTNIKFSVRGSNETNGTGNELHIGGVKGSTETSSANIWTNTGHSVDSSIVSINGINNITNFDKIVLHDVAWNTDQKKPVLYGDSISNVKALDITNMNIYDGDTIKSSFTSGESMSLLSSGNDISSIKLKYNDSEAVSLVNNPVTIGGGAYTDKVIIADLLKFSGTSADTVSLATDNKAIVYTAGESSVSSATFSGTADWSTSAALYSNTSYTFDTNATANLAGLQFNKTAAVTEDPMGQTMTLISGNVKGTVSVQPTDASIAVSLAKSNTTLGGTATGAAAIDAEAGNLTYTINNVALNSVAVTAAGDTPDALPTGWTKGSAVTVNTGATALDRATGATILSSDTAGLFTGATFSGVNDYNDATNNKHAFASDTAKGVTLDGTQQKGIKVSDDGKSLVYAVNDTKDVATITLGTVKTDDPRNMSGTDFDFAKTTKVDASALNLDVAEPLNISSPVIPLVTNATGLTAGVSVDYGEGKTGHSQDVPLTHADTGIVLNATVTGAVSTASGTVNYTVTGGTLNSIALDNWNGTAAGTLPAVITGTGVSVTTGNFAEPTLAAGQSIDIITTTTNNFFGSVTGDKEYKKGEAFDDTKNGVTLSGNKYGGVKTNDTKTTLTYYAESMKVDKVAFGEMAWGTGRAAASGYDFINVTSVDASGLTFTNPEEATGSMDLLTDATNLAANAAVDYGTGKSAHSQEFDKTLDNKAVVTATLTGTVDTATAGKVSYTSTGISMSKFDLANWDGATASAVPTGWTLSSGATVETAGMTTPVLDPGKHIDILQSDTDNFFANVTIGGGNEYKAADFTEKDGGITFAGSQSKGVTLNTEKKHVIYAVGTKDVSTATLSGEIKWDTTKAYYTNKQYTFSDSSKVEFAGDAAFTSTTDPLNQSMTLIEPDRAEHAVKGTVSGSPGFTVKLNNTTLEATATGTAAIDSGNLKYTVNSVTLNQVDVAAVGSDAVPAGWTAATNVTVDTENMTLPSEVAYGTPQNILTADSAIFTDDNITGKNKYGATPAAFADTDNAGTPAVTIAGQRDQGVKASADGKSLVYEVGTKEASSVTLGSIKWASGTEVMDGSNVEYDYTAVTSLGTDGFAMAFEAPETVDASKGESMTLLKANATLADMAEQVKQSSYSYNPVSGVTVDAAITGKLTTSSGVVTYTPMANQASKLTFTNVEWKDSGALMTRPANITFAGADVDTAKINFHNIQELAANSRMTLVSDFGETVGTITGDTFTVGSGLKGEGAASLSGTDLIFTAKTAAESLAPTEATHETVMAMEAGTAVVAAGREYVDSAVEGLGLVSNMAPDGTSTFASMGGGVGRYKTGSHVDTHTWSAVVAVGSKREHKKGDLEWGVFAEYGRGNYTLHDDNGGRGDGNTHYAGGGLLAKWTNKHDVYTEASFRMGRMSDSASNMLRDVLGNTYGYDVHANYFGGHVGLGKIYKVKGNKDLDVYGKFFYTRRNGVDFDAGGNHYSLDSVASKLLRIGARYGSNDRKWNWYGGLAYEYEFGGESRGTVDGLAIRSASIKGASVRGEIGVRLEATKTNPWKADISIYGYGGKHRGIGGNVSVAYMF